MCVGRAGQRQACRAPAKDSDCGGDCVGGKPRASGGSSLGTGTGTGRAAAVCVSLHLCLSGLQWSESAGRGARQWERRVAGPTPNAHAIDIAQPDTHTYTRTRSPATTLASATAARALVSPQARSSCRKISSILSTIEHSPVALTSSAKYVSAASALALALHSQHAFLSPSPRDCDRRARPPHAQSARPFRSTTPTTATTTWHPAPRHGRPRRFQLAAAARPLHTQELEGPERGLRGRRQRIQSRRQRVRPRRPPVHKRCEHMEGRRRRLQRRRPARGSWCTNRLSRHSTPAGQHTVTCRVPLSRRTVC